MIRMSTGYPAYVDSGVSWLGQVPVHWEVARLWSFLSALESGGREQSDADSSTGVPSLGGEHIGKEGLLLLGNMRYVSQEYFSKLHRGRIASGDVLLVKDGATIGKVAYVEKLPFKQCGVNEHVYIMRTKATIQPAFLYYLTRTTGVQDAIWQYVTGSAQPGLSSGFAKNIGLCVPPLSEQTVIVRYLDHADRKVRHAIHARQQLIKLLTEQKQAIIQRAITRGLDPNVRLKPSGVPWLGDVPEHWEVRRLKTVSHMKSGESITGLAIDQVGEYPVYGGNGLRGYTSAYTHDGEYALIGRQGALCGNVHQAHGRFWASEHAVVASLRDGYGLSWFCSLLDVMNLNQYSMAAAQPGLAVEQIMNLWISVPPADEQGQISDYLDGATANLDKAIDAARREIGLLREYRTRLIADVVTGKLDVRDAATYLPDEPEEQPEPLDEEPVAETSDLDTEESDGDQSEHESRNA